MTDVQLNCINDENKYLHLHRPSHSTKQKPISAKTLYIVTLLDSEAQICDQTDLSGATISYVHCQHHSNLPRSSGDDPFILTITVINYVKHIICM